jgi:hypothetical protein
MKSFGICSVSQRLWSERSGSSSINVVTKPIPGRSTVVVAGAVSILAKHLVNTSSYDKVRHGAMKSVKSDVVNQRFSAGSLQQQISSGISTLTPSSSSEHNGIANIDPKVADLNARIRERLKEDTARDRSRSAKRPASGARLPAFSNIDHELSQDTPHKPGETNGGSHTSRKDWTQSDAQMLQQLIKVFEEKFGVKVDLQDKA